MSSECTMKIQGSIRHANDYEMLWLIFTPDIYTYFDNISDEVLKYEIINSSEGKQLIIEYPIEMLDELAVLLQPHYTSNYSFRQAVIFKYTDEDEKYGMLSEYEINKVINRECNLKAYIRKHSGRDTNLWGIDFVVMSDDPSFNIG